ncbi:MAG: class I SAM-dependent methyltransferase [Actinomycetota bacterium]|jgi:2-polyprenyl-3-methyl-5-hydroxy-6-metoxy-1,4-benzoquinol methylase|nr:class I SAM-dependent methyltransferase [Actinomycetota bacterium]
MSDSPDSDSNVSEWDEYASTWDDDAAVQAYAAAAFDSLLQLTAERGISLGGAHACDFGCVTERLAPSCAGVHAVDTSPAMLAVLSDKAVTNGWTHVRTSGRLPEGVAYDLIVCSSVLAFLDDHPATVRQLAERLRPGGLLVHWDWELDLSDEEPFGLSRDPIRDALTAAGLVDVTVGEGFSVEFGGQTMAPVMGAGVALR